MTTGCRLGPMAEAQTLRREVGFSAAAVPVTTDRSGWALLVGGRRGGREDPPS